MKRKFTALILAALCAATSSICLSACNFGNTPTTPVPPPSSGSEDEEQQPAPPALTFDGFIKNHKSAAVKFFEDFIYVDVVGNRSVKAENCYLNDKDGDNKVESAAMCYIYCLNETERAVEVANITFAPVNVQDVVDGKVTALNVTVSRNTVFTFDAKEEEKQAQASALLSETKLDGALLKSTAYTLETFEEEQPPVNPNPPEEPDDPVTVTNAEIISALNENCKIDLVKAVIPTSAANNFNENNLSDTIWYLTKDTDGNITKAELAFVYKTSETNAYYTVGELNLSSPISEKDLVDGKLGNFEYNRTIERFNFNPSIQAERADLTNAICDKVFDANDGTVRYIVDHGNNPGSSVGLARHFTVMEVRGNTIHQIDIDILQSSNDTEYISKLDNSSAFKTYSEKEHSISGEEVTIEAKENIQEVNYRYAVDFGDDDLNYINKKQPLI